MSLNYRLYRLLIDPLLKNLRIKVASLIPSGKSVIEIGSATGSQSILLSRENHNVVAVDINNKMINCASKRAKKYKIDNLKFICADATKLDFIGEREFDYAIITLALHELENDVRVKILSQMQRISKNLIIVDYNVPLPISTSGKVSLFIEKLVGGDHYEGFKDYVKRGGLLNLLTERKIIIEKQSTFIDNALIIIEAKS